MRSIRTTVFVSCVMMLLVLCAGTPVLAYTLRGTVYGGSSPMANASVTLNDAATQLQVRATSTNSDGTYSFTVSSGTYNLVVVPPAGSGFGQSVVNGITVNGSDLVQDVYIIPSSVSISGTIKSPSGTPMSNVQVVITPEYSSTVVYSTVTDATGHYAKSLASGNYWIKCSGSRSGTAVPNVPTPLDFTYRVGVSLATPLTQDIVIPFVTVSGRTTDRNGAAVAGVIVTEEFNIQSSSHYTVSDNLAVTGTNAIVSDTNGNYSMVVIADTYPYSFTVTPPSGSGLLKTTINNLSITRDVTRDLVVSSPLALSGTVKNLSGTPVSNVEVTITPAYSSTVAYSAVTDTTGRYSASLASGDYWIKCSGSRSGSAVPNVATPAEFTYRVGASLTADLTQDIAIPFVTVSGKTTNRDGAPVSGVVVTESFNIQSSDHYTVSDNTAGSGVNAVVSDGTGHYSMTVIADPYPYSFTLTPPAQGAYVATTVANVSVTADLNRDFVVSSLLNLSGTVKNPSGTPIRNIQVTITPEYSSSAVYSTVTDETGHYSALLASGNYWVRCDGSRTGGAVPNVATPADFTYRVGVTLAGDLTWDVSIPFVTVSGKTTDSNGVPIPGIVVRESFNIQSSDHYTVSDNPAQSGANAVISDDSGYYSMTVIADSYPYDFVVTPPAGSGFLETTLNGTEVSKDKLANYILPLPDTTAPVILSGPTVSTSTDTTATIEWQTNEPAEGGVSLDGVFAAEGSYATYHSFPLTGLTADTLYWVTVSASDKSGNGPTVSQAISFRTKPTPDTTPPVILQGPTVSAITHSSAVVEWSTDEPSRGSVLYGLTNAPGLTVTDSTLATGHRVILTGLSPETLYYVKATATDAVNNGPAATPSTSFRTMAAPDTIAPVVLEGPMAIDISQDSATIIWKTDEPATSGVSWNDGTSYGVLSDDALTTSHSVRISGLSAITGYSFTVSSKDAFANGPTLASASFTTLPTPDTKAPVLILEPVVKNINHQMALLYWETDEPSDSVIEYGTTEALGTSDAKAELLVKHNRPLTGLRAATTYYFRVLATDAAGNGPTASRIYSFTTDALPSSKPPVVTAGPDIIYSTDTGGTVYFETDVPCDTVVAYGAGSAVTNSQSNGEKVNKHQAAITNLTPNTSYSVQVSCTDLLGNTVVASAGRPATFLALNGPSSDVFVGTTGSTGFLTQSQPDHTAPVITVTPSVGNLTTTQASITWSTDEISDSQVNYNQSGQPLSRSSGDIAQVFKHTVALTNLTPGTTYQFAVLSADPSRNSVTSGTFSFTTPLLLNGSCGSASGGVFAEAPQANLCQAGTASGVTGTQTWSWSCNGENGGTAANCSANKVMMPLTLTISGTGTGTVTSSAGGIATNVSTSASFAPGATLTLHAAADEFSLFSSWLGDCTIDSSGNCAVVMNAPKSVTATFAKDSGHMTRIGESYYGTLQEAYRMAPAGGSVKAWSALFIENVVADQLKAVRLLGGYNSSYTVNGSFTVLRGALRIKNGRLTVNRLVIRP